MPPTMGEAAAALANRDAAIRELWETTDLTAAEIGRRFGMTRNAVIGMANRRNWTSRKPAASSSLMARMDELNARMDRVLNA